MTRIRELIEAVESAYPNDRFFADFAESLRGNQGKRRAYRTYDDALRLLDLESWHVLKGKAIKHFKDHRRGQLKQGFFNQLNEAFAYRYLVRQKCARVKILPEDTEPRPDIQYVGAGQEKHCEVKTLGLSDEEIQRRSSGLVYTSRYAQLDEGFFHKLSDAIKNAKDQIATQGTSGLVYLIVRWDDIAFDHYQEYRRQIFSYCRKYQIRDVYIKVDLRGSRRISITGPCV